MDALVRTPRARTRPRRRPRAAHGLSQRRDGRPATRRRRDGPAARRTCASISASSTTPMRANSEVADATRAGSDRRRTLRLGAAPDLLLDRGLPQCLACVFGIEHGGRAGARRRGERARQLSGLPRPADRRRARRPAAAPARAARHPSSSRPTARPTRDIRRTASAATMAPATPVHSSQLRAGADHIEAAPYRDADEAHTQHGEDETRAAACACPTGDGRVTSGGSLGAWPARARAGTPRAPSCSRSASARRASLCCARAVRALSSRRTSCGVSLVSASTRRAWFSRTALRSDASYCRRLYHDGSR